MYNDITFVILKSAYSADILYTIHDFIDAILFVQYMIFFIMHASLVIIFSEINNLTWELQEDGVQPCDCPTI